MKPNGSAQHGAETHLQANLQSALLSVEEVAALLKVPVSWVYDRTRLRTKERIPGFRLGKYWRFREADVLAWLEDHRARFIVMHAKDGSERTALSSSAPFRRYVQENYRLAQAFPLAEDEAPEEIWELNARRP